MLTIETKETKTESNTNVLGLIFNLIYRAVLVLLDIGSLIDKMYASATVLLALFILSFKKLNIIKDDKTRKVVQGILIIIWIIVMFITSK